MKANWLLTLLLLAPSAHAASLTLHVATNGNDRWSGRLASPAADLADGPLATLPATILVRGGVHRLDSPLVLTPADSGASADQPFTIAAYAGEKPLLSGGRRLLEWKPVPGRPGFWQADARSGAGTNWFFRSLFIDGQRATRARTPNEGAHFRMAGARFNDKPFQFHCRPGDVKPAWAAEGDVQIVAFEKWTDIRQFIRVVDPASNVVTLSGSSTAHTREAGAQYFVENAPDALDTPGEWRLDRKTGLVTIVMKPGANPNSAEVIASRLTELLRLEGDFAAKKAVRHVVVRGLRFADTDWTMPADGYRDTQAAVAIRGDVLADGATDCVIEDCTFTRLAGYAVDLGRGCQRNRIVGNEMFDLGAGGVRVGETASRSDPFDATHSNTISDNHLHHLGRIYPPAVGVFIIQSATNRVAHNDIHDLYYTAVSVGWTWGYRDSPCHANVIEFNHMHHIGLGLLSDMGAVYTLGPQPGTVVRNNLIHDVTSFTYGGWGLYTDEGSTGIVLENNVVHHCKSAGFHQHYGKENIIRNNIFAFGGENQLMRTRDEEHVSFFFTNNIVYFDSGNLLGSSWKNNRFVIDHNLYFDTRSRTNKLPLKFAGAPIETWRARGHDEHSLIADPLFVAPQDGDFTLRPDSPALQRGFKPIDLSTVGPRTRSRP
jgi:parallel beta-helix repeat protein